MFELFESARAPTNYILCAAFCYILRKQHKHITDRVHWQNEKLILRVHKTARGKELRIQKIGCVHGSYLRKRAIALFTRKQKYLYMQEKKRRKCSNLCICRTVGRFTCATSSKKKSSIVLYGRLYAAAAALPPILFGL